MQSRIVFTAAFAQVWLVLGCGSNDRAPGQPTDGGRFEALDSGVTADAFVDGADAAESVEADAARNLDAEASAQSDATAGSGSATFDDGTSKVAFSPDIVDCTNASDDAAGKFTMASRTEDYLTQVIVTCQGAALAEGTYPAADPYGTTTDACTLEVPWERRSYFSFGDGTIEIRVVDGMREISVQAVGARAYFGDAAGTQIEVSGTFTCPE